jgi:aspartyl-tRNA(Asn)/glutamyl-tRNA(Gln) amidotransferase subunit C
MITREEIEKLATLSRIQISDEEKESMSKDIESILEYVGQIKNISTSVDRETPSLRNVMRDDVVTHESGEFTDDLLSLAPAREGNYLKVKKIL